MILHKDESSIIFNNENDLSQIFQFDLEKGKIVEQFKVHSDVATAELR